MKRTVRFGVAVFASAMFMPQLSGQVCKSVKNIGNNVGRCVDEGNYCYLSGKNESIPTGTCESSGGPTEWGCTCNLQGKPHQYFFLELGGLSSSDSQPGAQSAGIGLSTVNNFSDAVTFTCSVTGAAPGSTVPSCSVNPSTIAAGNPYYNATLLVPTQGLPPGNFTVTVSATGGSARDSATTTLTIPVAKQSGGGTISMVIFAALLGLWASRFIWPMRRGMEQ